MSSGRRRGGASAGPAGPPRDEAVVWHDVECAGYAEDLAVWEELAAAAPGPTLELGAGTGRVALHLAAGGHELATLDPDPSLVEELRRRAREHRLPVAVHAGDARAFELGRRFPLIIAPMQVVQLLGGADGRASMLAAVRRHLEPGGRFAAAVADPLEGGPAEDLLPPVPDVRELDGWAWSSRPLTVRASGGEVVIERLRESVSPDGELSASAATVRLEQVEAGQLERQASRLGFRALAPRRVAATEAYVGSTVVVLEAS